MEIWHTLLHFRVHTVPSFQFHWKCKEQQILDLCFADDVLVFCKADIPSISVIKDTLCEFAELSGLKVNPHKSQIILSRAAQQDKQQILEFLGFQEGCLPVRYLGVPLSASRLTIADCKPLIDKLETRIAGWNHLNLTFAGRVQLIRSVLNTLHSYWASVFILPKGIIKILEAKIRKFLWQGSTGRGYAKVAWEQICRPKEEGGLGFRSIMIMNQALMLKHLWKLIQPDSESIWVNWILHYRLRKTTLWTFTGSTGSWGWKKMIKLKPFLKRGTHYRVGDGSTFKLWQDIWHEQGPLCLSHPEGPQLTGLPLDALLSSVIQHGQWSWPAISDAEFNEVSSQLPPIHPNSPDEITWRLNSGKFTVQSAIELFQPHTNQVEWHGLLQGRYKIPRHSFILWLAIMEKLSTMDKAWLSHGDNGCVFCDGHFTETHEHLFFNCQYSKRCLHLVQRQVRFQWPCSSWQHGIHWASKRWRSSHLVNAASRALLAALVYYIWIERNNRRFNNTATAAESVAYRVVEEIRLRIQIEECNPSLQTRALYRIWKIAWPH
ncbi:UNVERIFIED_CONTAM: hypothetical protein Sradi_6931100 [Sesamum radiatum]|uniref:Reverse transcriptase zinc-binding domain-containing protein n=1 Tax=Sesamum radiatum TaxID=300843 RepID=A0AAW2JII7_SESRA